MVYTCITDTGFLVWYFTDSTNQLYRSGPAPQVTHKDIFTLELISANGSVLISTATAHNVSLDYDGRNINCSNSDIRVTSEQMTTIRISKQCTH